MSDPKEAIERAQSCINGELPNADFAVVGIAVSDLRLILADNERLRAALKPFANLGVGSGPDDEHDAQPYRILRGAIRNARAALNPELEGDKG